jgi:hypothetical protein
MGLLRRPKCRWEYNIEIDIIEIRRGGMDWIDLAQDRDHWRALVKKGTIECSEILEQLSEW